MKTKNDAAERIIHVLTRLKQREGRRQRVRSTQLLQGHQRVISNPKHQSPTTKVVVRKVSHTNGDQKRYSLFYHFNSNFRFIALIPYKHLTRILVILLIEEIVHIYMVEIETRSKRKSKRQEP